MESEILSSALFLARQEIRTDLDQADPKRSQVVQIVREAEEARGGMSMKIFGTRFRVPRGMEGRFSTGDSVMAYTQTDLDPSQATTWFSGPDPDTGQSVKVDRSTTETVMSWVAPPRWLLEYLKNKFR